jgi:hypothetical protein
MAWESDLETVVARTGVEHYRKLCSEAYHDHLRMREKISLMAREPAPASFPPAGVQIGNALGAIGRAAHAAVSGQPVFVPNEVRDERWAQCMTCVNLVNDRCRLCGCYFAKKITLATESCPMSPPRWGAYHGESNHGS